MHQTPASTHRLFARPITANSVPPGTVVTIENAALGPERIFKLPVFTTTLGPWMTGGANPPPCPRLATLAGFCYSNTITEGDNAFGTSPCGF